MHQSVPSASEPRFTRPPDDAYSPDEDPSYARHQLVNNAIRERLINRITGRGSRSEQLRGVKPKNQFFAGALVSQYEFQEAKDEGESFKNIAQDISPFTIGVTFRVGADIADDAEITCNPQAVGFQRRFPTLSEQKESANDKESASVLYEEEEKSAQSSPENHEHKDSDTVTVEDDYDDDEITHQELLRVYERIPFEWEEITLAGSQIKDVLSDNSPAQIELETQDAKERARSVSRRFRERTNNVSESDANQVPLPALSNETVFRNYLREHFDGEEVEPLWDARLEIEVQQEDKEDLDKEYLSVTVRLVNSHGENIAESEDPEYEYWRSTLFDVGVEARVSNGQMGTFDSKEIEDEYQYEGSIYGVGEKCAVEPIYEDNEGEEGQRVVGVRTETVPTYRQPRYLSRDPGDISPRMDILAGNDGRDAVFETLESIAELMNDAEIDYRDIREEMTAEKSDSAARDFDDAVEQFNRERQRFEFGIKCLREDERAYQAFTLLNQTFANMGEFDTWRVFQIIFIVMSIPDMLKQASAIDDDFNIDFEQEDSLDQLDIADIIYFPTGGGKTEAYLGLVTFTAFLDRIRGKEYGMTAYTKFPLRFLSLQQLQRVADVFAEAELLRRDHNLGGEEFSIGYLVGKQNTPNKLKDEGVNYIRRAEDDEEFQQKVLYVDTCPFCGEEQVEITGDDERGRIIHECTNDACAETELPVYVTDREVYRYAPTFVVSTIDKISIIGMQRRMRTLFGQAKIRCEKHGYSGEKTCTVQNGAIVPAGECSTDDWEKVNPVEPPSLLIQDELHLLREEFGAFDSHYETFIQAYNNKITDDSWDMKVVAATATIEGSERQVRALYQKESTIYPAKSPRLKQSFYAYADPIRTQRTMVGAITRSVSRTYALEKLHEEYARTIEEFRASPEELHAEMEKNADTFELKDADLPEDEDEREVVLQRVLDDYEVQVSYHYSKDNTDLMMRVLRTMINRHLTEDIGNYEPLNGKLMTGETDLGEVRAILNRLTNYDEEDVDPVHLLIATSMISHGVDIDRLNFIGFFGLPRQTAEYIQSYSRVGRKWPGTVFLLHNPMRVRDRTYYTRFQHYQEYQDLLVEATPLERWAEFAIECTMPGIFSAALLQYYDFELEDELNERIYMYEGFEEAARNHLEYDEVLEFVKEAYGVLGTSDADDAESGSGIEIYRQQIEQEFDKLWDACLNEKNRVPPHRAKDPSIDENNFIPLGVLARDEDVRTPMRNLRDIDEQVTIAPDGNTSRLINSYRQR